MRYYFNVCDGHALVDDPEGAEYRDEGSARQAAIESARALLSEGDLRGTCRRHWRFEVHGPDRNRLFDIPFSHALEPATLKLGDARC